MVRPETDRVLIVAEAQHGAAADDVAALAREIDAGLAATGVQVTAAMRLRPGRPPFRVLNRPAGRGPMSVEYLLTALIVDSCCRGPA